MSVKGLQAQISKMGIKIAVALNNGDKPAMEGTKQLFLLFALANPAALSKNT